MKKNDLSLMVLSHHGLNKLTADTKNLMSDKLKPKSFKQKSNFRSKTLDLQTKSLFGNEGTKLTKNLLTNEN